MWLKQETTHLGMVYNYHLFMVKLGMVYYCNHIRLPGLLGIMISHSRETYQPTSIMRCDI